MRALEEELAEWDRASLRRTLPVVTRDAEDGGELAAFSSNDYLGLARHPQVAEALRQAVARHGAGAGASRLLGGTSAAHTRLEETLAAFKGTEAALVFSTGYAAAVGALGGLLRPGDVAVLDKLAHASLIDGARLSGADIRVFAHNNPAQLEKRLAWAVGRAGEKGRVLVATESVFSMDGDRAPLREIAAVARRFGAMLLVDEAHSFGLCGRGGRGLSDALGLTPEIGLHLGTLSKAVGLAGGYVCASRAAIEVITNRARSFIYSTAPPAALAEAAAFVIGELFPGPLGEESRARLWCNAAHFAREMGQAAPPDSAIFPLIIGGEERALQAAAWLRAEGFAIPAIRYPTVARGRARLRVSLSARHELAEIDRLLACLRRLPDVPNFPA